MDSETNMAMTQKELKQAIKKKFGTYSNFCSLVVPPIDRYHFQKYFLTNQNVSQSEINRLNRLVERTINAPLEEFKKNVIKIRKAIDKTGGVSVFCDKNRGFAENTVYQIISDSSYKRMTPTIKKLMKALGI